MRTEILHLSRIEKETQDYAIHDVNMHIFRGEIVGLLGLTQTGKSAIVHILTGEDAPDSGIITVNETSYASLASSKARQSGIFSLGFSNYIIKNLTVAENLFAFHHPRFQFSYSRKEMMIKAEYVLKQFNLDIPASALAKDISHTRQALICLIKIALTDPILVIVDSGIEYEVEDIAPIVDLIKYLKSTGISFLIVSNKVSRLVNSCDCFYSIKDHTLSNRIEAWRLSPDAVQRLLIDQAVPYSRHSPASETSSIPLLQVFGLKHLAGHTGISFDLYKGEMLLLIPPSDIVPDTVAGCLFGLIPHAEGEVYVNQKRIKLKSSRDAIANGIAFVPDEPDMTVFRNMDLKDNLLLPYYSNSRFFLRPVNPVFQNVAAQELKKGYDISSGEESAAIKKENPGIAEIHKISVARWEALKPQIYIFLNPFSVVDEEGAKSLFSQMQRLARTGCGVLIISNNSYGLESSNIRTITF